MILTLSPRALQKLHIIDGDYFCGKKALHINHYLKFSNIHRFELRWLSKGVDVESRTISYYLFHPQPSNFCQNLKFQTVTEFSKASQSGIDFLTRVYTLLECITRRIKFEVVSVTRMWTMFKGTPRGLFNPAALLLSILQTKNASWRFFRKSFGQQ